MSNLVLETKVFIDKDTIKKFIIKNNKQPKEYSEDEISLKSKILAQKLHKVEKNFTNGNDALGYHNTLWDRASEILDSGSMKLRPINDRAQWHIDMARKHIAKIEEYQEKSKNLFIDVNYDDINILDKITQLNKEYHTKIKEHKESMQFYMDTVETDQQIFFYRYIYQAFHGLSSLKFRFKGNPFIFVCDLESLAYKIREFYFDYSKPERELFIINGNRNQFVNDFVKNRKLQRHFVHDEIIINQVVETSRITRMYLVNDFKINAVFNKIDENKYQMFIVK